MPAPKTPNYDIHIIVKSYQSAPDFWGVVEQGALVAAEELGVNVSITGPKSEADVDDQITLIREAIQQAPDAIIIAASDYHRIAPICVEIAEENIPLIVIDSDVDCNNRKAFIATDNVEIGEQLANLVDAEVGTNAPIGVIGHVKGTSTAVDRYQGLIDNLEGGEDRIVKLEYCDGDPSKAKEQAIAMINDYPEIKCIVGLNETSGLGVSRGLLATGRSGEIMQISCDSSREQIQYMETNTVQALVVQNPFNMGYISVNAAVSTLNGDKLESFIETGSVVIKREDMYKPENQKLLFPFNEAMLDDLED